MARSPPLTSSKPLRTASSTHRAARRHAPACAQPGAPPRRCVSLAYSSRGATLSPRRQASASSLPDISGSALESCRHLLVRRVRHRRRCGSCPRAGRRTASPAAALLPPASSALLFPGDEVNRTAPRTVAQCPGTYEPLPSLTCSGDGLAAAAAVRPQLCSCGCQAWRRV